MELANVNMVDFKRLNDWWGRVELRSWGEEYLAKIYILLRDLCRNVWMPWRKKQEAYCNNWRPLPKAPIPSHDYLRWSPKSKRVWERKKMPARVLNVALNKVSPTAPYGQGGDPWFTEINTVMAEQANRFTFPRLIFQWVAHLVPSNQEGIHDHEFVITQFFCFIMGRIYDITYSRGLNPINPLYVCFSSLPS